LYDYTFSPNRQINFKIPEEFHELNPYLNKEEYENGFLERIYVDLMAKYLYFGTEP